MLGIFAGGIFKNVYRSTVSTLSVHMIRYKNRFEHFLDCSVAVTPAIGDDSREMHSLSLPENIRNNDGNGSCDEYLIMLILEV